MMPNEPNPQSNVDDYLTQRLTEKIEQQKKQESEMAQGLKVKPKVHESSPPEPSPPLKRPFLYIDEHGEKQETLDPGHSLTRNVYNYPEVKYDLKLNDQKVIEASLPKLPTDKTVLCYTILQMINDVIANSNSNELEIETKDPVAQAICQHYIESLGLTSNLTQTPLEPELQNIIHEGAEKIKNSAWFPKLHPQQNPSMRFANPG